MGWCWVCELPICIFMLLCANLVPASCSFIYREFLHYPCCPVKISCSERGCCIGEDIMLVIQFGFCRQGLRLMSLLNFSLGSIVGINVEFTVMLDMDPPKFCLFSFPSTNLSGTVNAINPLSFQLVLAWMAPCLPLSTGFELAGTFTLNILIKSIIQSNLQVA